MATHHAVMAGLTHAEYRTIVEQSPIMIWRANIHKECDYFNDRWLGFTGRSARDELGHGWAAGVHEEDRARCFSIFSNAFELREVFEMEYRLRRKDGAFRWILDRGVPFLGDGGIFSGYIGSCIDIEERKQLEHGRQAMQKQRFDELEGLLPVCAWCKRVRTDDGYWEALDRYLARRLPNGVSHGICPDCQKHHFGPE